MLVKNHNNKGLPTYLYDKEWSDTGNNKNMYGFWLLKDLEAAQPVNMMP